MNAEPKKMTAAERFLESYDRRLALDASLIDTKERKKAAGARYELKRMKRRALRRRRQLVTVYDVEDRQRLDCANRPACLDAAAKAEERGLSCVGCNRYQPEARAKIDPWQNNREWLT